MAPVAHILAKNRVVQYESEWSGFKAGRYSWLSRVFVEEVTD
jgi:hypothetical protein